MPGFAFARDCEAGSTEVPPAGIERGDDRLQCGTQRWAFCAEVTHGVVNFRRNPPTVLLSLAAIDPPERCLVRGRGCA